MYFFYNQTGNMVRVSSRVRWSWVTYLALAKTRLLSCVDRPWWSALLAYPIWTNLDTKQRTGLLSEILVLVTCMIVSIFQSFLGFLFFLGKCSFLKTSNFSTHKNQVIAYWKILHVHLLKSKRTRGHYLWQIISKLTQNLVFVVNYFHISFCFIWSWI